MTVRTVRTPVLIVAIAVAYFLAGRLGLGLARVNPSATAVWPPTGIALAACLIFGPRVWPGIAIAAFLVNLTTTGNPFTSAGIAIGNTTEALLGAWMVRRFASGGRVLDSPGNIFRFAGLAGLLATAVSATIGVGTLILGGLARRAGASEIWLTWWLGDAAGALVIAPFLILWSRIPRFTWNLSRTLEVGLIGLVVVGVDWWAFRGPFDGFPMRFLILPVLLWSAFRFTQREAATAVVLLAAIAVVSTEQRLGPFAIYPRDDAQVLLQGFLSTISITVLAVSAVIAERRRALASVRQLNEALEDRVVERTERLAGANRTLRELIHERALAAEELRASEARLREAQEVARIGSWEWDVVANTLWWSDVVLDLYGLDPAAFGGRYEDFASHLHPEDRERVEHEVAEAIRERRAFSMEHRIVRPDGGVLTLQGRGRVVCGADGQPVRLVGTAQDITDRLRAEEERSHRVREQSARREAEEANRLKDEFLATLSHELRNPLNAIVGWARLLRDGRLDPPTTARAVEAINRSADLQSQLILDLLDLSRITSGRVELQHAPVDPATLIEDVFDTLRPTARLRGVELVGRFERPSPVTTGDPQRLRQVLWNLVSNAVRFAAEGGRVTVISECAEGADARLTLRVEDDGPGIPSELLPWVFDPFRQGRPHRTRRHDGLGLGLAIAKRLVELHGGTVTAENLTPHGAAFTVTLPISAAAPGAGTTAEERELALAAHGNGGGEGTSLQGVRVLVVEDVRDSRELLETLLGARGAEVVAAESCAGALEAFLARPPDVMISDIEMPDGNGFDLIARIRALPTDRGGDVPAIALTAYAGVEHARRALASGYQAHVAKPFEGAQLLGIVEELLRGHPAPT